MVLTHNWRPLYFRNSIRDVRARYAVQCAEAGNLWPDGSQIADDDGKASLTMEWEHYLLRNLGASNRDCPFAVPIRGSLPNHRALLKRGGIRCAGGR